MPGTRSWAQVQPNSLIGLMVGALLAGENSDLRWRRFEFSDLGSRSSMVVVLHIAHLHIATDEVHSSNKFVYIINIYLIELWKWQFVGASDPSHSLSPRTKNWDKKSRSKKNLQRHNCATIVTRPIQCSHLNHYHKSIPSPKIFNSHPFSAAFQSQHSAPLPRTSQICSFLGLEDFKNWVYWQPFSISIIVL